MTQETPRRHQSRGKNDFVQGGLRSSSTGVFNFVNQNSVEWESLVPALTTVLYGVVVLRIKWVRGIRTIWYVPVLWEDVGAPSRISLSYTPSEPKRNILLIGIHPVKGLHHTEAN